jgi:hypothetical protein
MQDTLYIYTRVSTEIQVEKGFSLEAQKNIGIEKANQLNMNYEIFEEAGKSAAKEDLENRPVIKRLLRKIEEKQAKYIFVIEDSRLSRNIFTSAEIANIFMKYACIVYTPYDKTDYGNLDYQTKFRKRLSDFMAKQGNIAGWKITSNWLESPGQKFIINNTSSSLYARPLGSGTTTKYVMFGQTHDGNNFTGHYGISAVNGNNQYIFRLDDYATQIGGWAFDNAKFYTSNNYKYVGMQSPSSETTKVFFAGASDNTGTSASFSVQTNGKTLIKSGSITMFDSDLKYSDASNNGRVIWQSATTYSSSGAGGSTTLPSFTYFKLPYEKNLILAATVFTGDNQTIGNVSIEFYQPNPTTSNRFAETLVTTYYLSNGSGLFGSGLSNCFEVNSTNILMSNGSVKLLKDVEVGDKIISFNELKKSFEISEVSELRRDTKTEIYNINNDLLVTDEHPLWTDYGYKQVKNINVGDTIYKYGYQPEVVETKTLITGSFEVGSFTMKDGDNPSFIANNYIAHNKPAATEMFNPGVISMDMASLFGETNNSSQVYRVSIILYNNTGSGSCYMKNITVMAGRDLLILPSTKIPLA